MKKNTRALSLTALFAAGAVVVMYITSALPTMTIAFAAVAGLFTGAAVIEGGLSFGFLAFGASGLLAALLIPEKTGVLLYITFFGYYPIVKSIGERRQNNILCWAIKGGVFLAVLTLYLFGIRELVLGDINPAYLEIIPLVYVAGAVIFVLYDYGLSKLISFYLSRIYKHRNG